MEWLYFAHLASKTALGKKQIQLISFVRNFLIYIYYVYIYILLCHATLQSTESQLKLSFIKGQYHFNKQQRTKFFFPLSSISSGTYGQSQVGTLHK